MGDYKRWASCVKRSKNVKAYPGVFFVVDPVNRNQKEKIKNLDF